MKTIRYLFMVCLIAVFICWNGISVSATETEVDTSVFEYEENNDGTISIINYYGTDETVIIPSEIDRKKVADIKLNYDNSRFIGDCSIKYLTISEGITDIMRYSFRDCRNLESVYLPSTLKTIGKSAFADCKYLKKINLPEGLTSIGERAFDNCYRLENIFFPKSLVSIGEYAFSLCHSLSKITIPGNLKVIPTGSFHNCLRLQEVEIEEGVTKIETIAFLNCSKLQKVIIPKSIIDISDSAFVISGKIFPNVTIYADPNSYAREYAKENKLKFNCMDTHIWDDGIITDKSIIKSDDKKSYTCTYTCIACGMAEVRNTAMHKKGRIVINLAKDSYRITKAGIKNGTVEFVKSGEIKSIVSIPDEAIIDGITYKVTSIAKSAFKNNRTLEKITIGKNITKINANAFSGCKNLKSITIKSKNIIFVGKNAFKGIKLKAKIKVPSSKLENYKKLLNNKGQKPSVKIIK